MRKLLLLLFTFSCYSDLLAQDSTLVTIKTGHTVNDVLTSGDIYYYPEFTNGNVYFKGGEKAVAKMNYTRLFDQMLFIDPKGDTLALADEKIIKFIIIERDTFYYDEGYMRLIADDGGIKLAVKEIWVVADVRKIGTHNRPTSTVAISSLTSITNGKDAAKSKDLILNEDIVLRKETQYYFGNEYGHFVPATRKRLLQLFPKGQRRIGNYLKDSKVDFNKKDDVEKLYQFLSQLK